MTTNHTNQQNIHSSQSNELVSRLESIEGVEELNEAKLDSITGGILKLCTQTNKWIDVGDYHLMPMRRPTSTK